MTSTKESNFTWKNRELTSAWQESLKRIESSNNKAFTELFDFKEPQKGPLEGAIISVKDLFKVTGYKTMAGSRFLDSTPAKKDAAAVAQLRAAGATFIGHTNMTELAYSGLGLNPHYGTPENPIKAGRITGGSTSGGAASVALGVADGALGTDTGGSLRIPAAFCGVTGFKPSQQTVSQQGCLPLSASLDSVGPIANTVEECELLWRVLSSPTTQKANDQEQSNTATDLSQYTFVIPTNFGMTDLDPLVEKGFREQIALLMAAGFTVEERAIDALEAYKTIPVWQFSAFESQIYYGKDYDLNQVEIDPRVISRIRRANNLNSDEFASTQLQRSGFIENMANNEGNTIVLLPTVAITAPKLTDFAEDAEYDRLNLLSLRNTSLANVLNGCSISLPFQYENEPMGLMLTAGNGLDQALLDIAKVIEDVTKKEKVTKKEG